jgi:hypothetical protein
VGVDLVEVIASSPSEVSGHEVNLLADDWSCGSAWHALLKAAERDPCRFVLSHATYREADSAKLPVGLAVRNL